MDNSLLEREPEQPEPAPETVLERAYTDFLESLVLHDAETLLWAGNVIRNSGNNIFEDSDGLEAKLTETFGSILASKLLENAPEAEIQRTTEIAFESCLRAYVYSGLEINPQAIHIVSEMFGKNNKWLRGLLVPNSTNFLVIIGKDKGKEPEAFTSFRTIGNHALLKLGIAPLGQRLFSPLRLSR